VGGLIEIRRDYYYKSKYPKGEGGLLHGGELIKKIGCQRRGGFIREGA